MKDQWVKLKEWWSNLAIREQQALVTGALVLGVLVIYQVIWSPMVDHVAFLRHQIQTKENLLAWMQTTDKQIQQMQGRSQRGEKPLSPVVALSFLQKQIHQARLESQLSELRQVSADSLEMHFQKVEFVKFIRLLARVVSEQRLAIAQLLIRVESTPGIVTADVMFSVFP
jgi:type II secretory pathway component PulM